MENKQLFNIYTTFARTLAKMMYPCIECHLIDYKNIDAPTCLSFFKDKEVTSTGYENIPQGFHQNSIQEKLKSNFVSFSFVNKKGKRTKASVLGIYNQQALIGCLAIHFETAYFQNIISLFSHFIETQDSDIIMESRRFDSGLVENSLEKIVSEYRLDNNIGSDKLKACV